MYTHTNTHAHAQIHVHGHANTQMHLPPSKAMLLQQELTGSSKLTILSEIVRPWGVGGGGGVGGWGII